MDVFEFMVCLLLISPRFRLQDGFLKYKRSARFWLAHADSLKAIADHIQVEVLYADCAEK